MHFRIGFFLLEKHPKTTAKTPTKHKENTTNLYRGFFYILVFFRPQKTVTKVTFYIFKEKYIENQIFKSVTLVTAN